MIEFMKNIIEINPKLNERERSLLSVAYKYSIADKRKAWLGLKNLEIESKINLENELKIIV